jgi:hypothetical protein
MISKQENIEVIQDRLSGSGTPDDIRKFYPYSIIEAIVSKAYSDLWNENPESMNDMAMEYDLTLSTDNGYYSTLSIKPIGSAGLLWVQGNNVFIPTVQGGMQGKILSLVEPGGIPKCQLVNGTKIVFTSKPEEPLKALYIPNYDDLDDDDNVVLMGAESAIYMKVIQMIRATDGNPEEFYNDGRNDARKVPPKQEYRRQ